jgi:hypothetical protein|tara:strand:+ start:832 stop:1005 length:174 start_codon:yes stop_codon:yes gene_type:complete
MSVKELIKTAMNKDATEFESKFNDIMADKMTSAIENKYTDMFQPEAAENIEVATDEE